MKRYEWHKILFLDIKKIFTIIRQRMYDRNQSPADSFPQPCMLELEDESFVLRLLPGGTPYLRLYMIVIISIL